MTTMSSSEARAELPALLDRVEHGEEVTITRHGRAVAVVLRPDSVRSRRAAAAIAAAERVRERLARARELSLSDVPELTEDQAVALVDHVRAGRDAR